MRPLKLLVVTESHEVWGAERTLLELAKNVDRTRVTLTFLVAHNSPLAPKVADLGFHVEFHRFAKHEALTKFGSLGAADRRTLVSEAVSGVTGGLRLAFKVRKHDVVLSFSIWQAIETLIAAKVAFRPYVLDLHETFSGDKGHAVVRLLARFSKAVIAPSRSVLDRSHIKLANKVKVIPRPVSAKPADSLVETRPEGMITLGMFGQISPHKGVREVLLSVEEVGTAAVQLIIVGGRPAGTWSEYETDVRQLASRPGSNATVHDAVPSVYELMSRCNFVVNASDHEAFGRGVVEAIAGGAVPIAIGRSGPQEIVSDTGIGVSLNSIADLAPYLRGMVDGIEPPPRTDEALVKAAMHLYDPSKIAADYFRHLEKYCTS